MPRLIGWREWATLPDLGIDAIEVKADTGARTSALHAVAIRSIKIDGNEWVEFEVDGNNGNITSTKARVVDHRTVRDSGGHEETRVAVETTLRMGGEEWPIELTLTDRETMGFRMLLGRTAMKGHFYVDADAKFILDHKPARAKRPRKMNRPEEQVVIHNSDRQEEE